MNFQLVIDDAQHHPLMKGNRTVEELGVAAYLGSPISVHPDKAIGTICAIEHSPRRWTEANIEDITIAAVAANKLLLRLV